MIPLRSFSVDSTAEGGWFLSRIRRHCSAFDDSSLLNALVISFVKMFLAFLADLSKSSEWEAFLFLTLSSFIAISLHLSEETIQTMMSLSVSKWAKEVDFPLAGMVSGIRITIFFFSRLSSSSFLEIYYTGGVSPFFPSVSLSPPFPSCLPSLSESSSSTSTLSSSLVAPLMILQNSSTGFWWFFLTNSKKEINLLSTNFNTRLLPFSTTTKDFQASWIQVSSYSWGLNFPAISLISSMYFLRIFLVDFLYFLRYWESFSLSFLNIIYSMDFIFHRDRIDEWLFLSTPSIYTTPPSPTSSIEAFVTFLYTSYNNSQSFSVDGTYLLMNTRAVFSSKRLKNWNASVTTRQFQEEFFSTMLQNTICFSAYFTMCW